MDKYNTNKLGLTGMRSLVSAFATLMSAQLQLARLAWSLHHPRQPDIQRRETALSPELLRVRAVLLYTFLLVFHLSMTVCLERKVIEVYHSVTAAITYT